MTATKSRVRESRSLGSVRAKAEWLSYSTTTLRHIRDNWGDIFDEGNVTFYRDGVETAKPW